MKEVNCRNCDNLQTDYPIKVVDIPAVNVFDTESYHFENGYKCTWNAVESLNIDDLQQGNCRCKKDTTYNGWTNWDTWEAYGLITSNDEKAYNLILRQLKKSDYLGIRSIKAFLKVHNKNLRKEDRTELTVDLDAVNMDELLESLKEHMGVD